MQSYQDGLIKNIIPKWAWLGNRHRISDQKVCGAKTILNRKHCTSLYNGVDLLIVLIGQLTLSLINA